jgi:hypothetical protein
MQEQLVKVIFKGEVFLGQDVELVKHRVMKKFNLKQEAADRLFSGKIVTVKKNIPRETALKYREAFRQAGAICTIEWMDPEYVNKIMESSEYESLKMVTCPKCGEKQERGEICEFCGYEFKPLSHVRSNPFTLIYETLREKGVPKWVIFGGACVLFFALIVPMFIPRGTQKIPVLYDRDIGHFSQTTANGLVFYQWNFSNKKKYSYDFERMYQKESSVNAYDPNTEQSVSRSGAPFGSRGTVSGRLVIQNQGGHMADIRLSDCQQSQDYNMDIFNMMARDTKQQLPDIEIRNLTEQGSILSPVSSDCAFFHLLFRIPESISQIGNTEKYTVSMDYQGSTMEGEAVAELESFVMIDGCPCARLKHEFTMTSGRNDYQGDYFEISGTLTSCFDILNRMVILGRLEQTIEKNTYQMYNGFYTWVTSSHNETITYMKKGLAKKLNRIRD